MPAATLDILRQRIFWLTVLSFTPLAMAFGGAQQNLGPYASDLDIEAQAAAYLVSVMALVMVAAKIFFGAMADRWDLRALFLLTVADLLNVAVGPRQVSVALEQQRLARAHGHRLAVDDDLLRPSGQFQGVAGPYDQVSS